MARHGDEIIGITVNCLGDDISLEMASVRAVGFLLDVQTTKLPLLHHTGKLEEFHDFTRCTCRAVNGICW